MAAAAAAPSTLNLVEEIGTREFLLLRTLRDQLRLRRSLAATPMRIVALLAACFALACGGRGPWRAISREAETAADIISQREGGALTSAITWLG